MADYIPSSDAEFDNWQKHFVELAEGSLGESVAVLFNQLDPAGQDFANAYEKHLVAQDASKAAKAAKDVARAKLTTLLRTAAQIAQNNPKITDEQRVAAGLPVRKTGREPTPAPTTRPVVEVDTSQRLRHTIHFRDEGAIGKARPDGVQGAEIWLKIGGEEPTSADELRFLGLDTRTPYTNDYEMSEAGETAYYLVRWISTRGETGPWSETVSATIGG